MEEDQKRKYEEYIKGASPTAAVIGRRVPYHLEYIRKYGTGPVPKEQQDGGRQFHMVTEKLWKDEKRK